MKLCDAFSPHANRDYAHVLVMLCSDRDFWKPGRLVAWYEPSSALFVVLFMRFSRPLSSPSSGQHGSNLMMSNSGEIKRNSIELMKRGFDYVLLQN